MKKAVFKAAVCAAVCCWMILFAAQAGRAQPFGPEDDRMEKGREKSLDAIFRKLNLTPEQKRKIEELRKQKRAGKTEERKKMHAYMEQIRQELDKFDSDREKIFAVSTEMDAMMRKMFRQRLENILALKSVLTREQFEIFKSEMDKERRRMEEFRKKHQMPPGGPMGPGGPPPDGPPMPEEK